MTTFYLETTLMRDPDNPQKDGYIVLLELYDEDREPVIDPHTKEVSSMKEYYDLMQDTHSSVADSVKESLKQALPEAQNVIIKIEMMFIVEDDDVDGLLELEQFKLDGLLMDPEDDDEDFLSLPDLYKKENLIN